MHFLSIHCHFNPPSNKRIKWCQYLGPIPLKRKWLQQQQQEGSEIKPSPLYHVMRHCNVSLSAPLKVSPISRISTIHKACLFWLYGISKSMPTYKVRQDKLHHYKPISQKWQETWNTGMHTWIIQVFNIKKRSNNKMPKNKLKHSRFMWQIINWYQPLCLTTW